MSNNAPDDIPVPTEEAWFTHSDGAKVYTKTWKTTGTPKARIVYLHGFSDHCNTCNPFFPILAARGIEVFGIDQRGWGQSVKSQKDRGVSGGTAQVMSDVSAYLRKFLPSFPNASSTSPSPDGVPCFLVGHSMGGQAVIYHAAHHPSPAVRGYIAMSPWIRLPADVAPNTLTVVSGQFAARFMPRFQVKQVVRAEMLSHDMEVVKAAKLDELCHDHFTLEGASGAITRGREIDAGKAVVSKPVRAFLLAHGTADVVCDHDGAKNFFDKCCKVEDKEFKSYEGWMHKIHDEGPYERKTQFANDIADWILARAN